MIDRAAKDLLFQTVWLDEGDLVCAFSLDDAAKRAPVFGLDLIVHEFGLNGRTWIENREEKIIRGLIAQGAEIGSNRMAFSIERMASAAEFLEHLRAFAGISCQLGCALKLRQNVGAIFRGVSTEESLGAFGNSNLFALEKPLATGQRHFSGRDFAGSDCVKDRLDPFSSVEQRAQND